MHHAGTICAASGPKEEKPGASDVLRRRDAVWTRYYCSALANERTDDLCACGEIAEPISLLL